MSTISARIDPVREAPRPGPEPGRVPRDFGSRVNGGGQLQMMQPEESVMRTESEVCDVKPELSVTVRVMV
jgi:hypothetical protein